MRKRLVYRLVQNVSGSTQSNPMARLFGRAQVDLNLSLGQLLRNALFPEAESEFQQFAFFNTRIVLRNAFQVQRCSFHKFGLLELYRNIYVRSSSSSWQDVLIINCIKLEYFLQDEIVEGEDKEVVLITLKRPLIYTFSLSIYSRGQGHPGLAQL